jgi:hypothetical protein
MTRAVLVGRAADGRVAGSVASLQEKVAAGLRRHGVAVEFQLRFDRGADFAICWGWRRGQVLRSLGARVLVMERGYIGPRAHWTSLAWNGLNGWGEFCLGEDIPAGRFARHFQMAPWKTGGARILVMGQVPGDMSLRGRDLGRWYDEAAAAARESYNLPVHFRPHPVAVQRGCHRGPLGPAGGPIAEELAKTALVITWNSNSAVDAVLAGVPAVVMDKGSMAWPVAAHSIGAWARPDREAWANRVAWCQWSPEELAGGDWWERMKVGIGGA